MIHHARQIPGSESVINIYHTDAARAGVQHGKQCGNTAEGRPIPDTRRHRDHRAVRKTADHACECAFHPRDRDDHAGIHDRIHMGHQAVQSRNSHIIEALHLISECLGRKRGFLRYRDIAGPTGRGGQSCRRRLFPGSFRRSRPSHP